MCDFNGTGLLYSTKVILKYLINKGPGYQTVYSLNFDFYNYSGLNIPFYDLGYSYLVEFLQSIPDILTVNTSTLEVQPSLKFHQTRDISPFSHYQVNHSLQRCHFIPAPTSSLYRPQNSKWTRTVNNSRKPNKRPFQPIPIRNPVSIIDNDASTQFPLSPRSYSDGNGSSTDSTENNQTSPESEQTSNDTMNPFHFVPTNQRNHNYSDLSSVRSQTELDKDEKSKFEEDLEEKKELDFSEARSSTPTKDLSLSLTSSEDGSMELKFEDNPPPPYSDRNDTCKAVGNDRSDSYDYDLHYYLVTPEEKISPDREVSQTEESFEIAIPFPYSEDDDPITMLDSGFTNGNYASKYKTTAIGDVMEVGKYYELYVSEVNSPYKFWFQLDEGSPNVVDELQEQLNTYYTMSSSRDSLDLIQKRHMRKGYACAALYDKIWHRGVIQDQPKDGSVKIFFVDYGTVDQVSIDDIRYLLNSFCNTPKLCYRGTLDFIKPLDYRWDIEATYFFHGLVENKKLIAGVSEVDRETNTVRLYLLDRENNINVNYEMVGRRYAFPEDPRDRYQRNVADTPTFDCLERGEYPSLAEVTTLLHHNYDYEKVLESTIIDDFDFSIPPFISEEENIQRVEAYKKTKEEAKIRAKQRDASIFLQFFGQILKNPFFNGTMTEEIEISSKNPFID